MSDTINSMYFFNDRYNETIINDYLSSFKERLYCSSLKAQKTLRKYNYVKGDISKIIIDKDINIRYNLPANSYIINIPKSIFPIDNEKAFLKNYGYDKKIPLTSVLKDKNTFSNVIILYIGKYAIMASSIICRQMGNIIVIENSLSDGISYDTMKNKVLSQEGEYFIKSVNIDEYYYLYKQRTDIISSDINNIFISKNNFSEVNIIHKQSSSNYWDLYITENDSEPNLLISTFTSLTNDDNFILSSEFGNYLNESHIPSKCYAVHSHTKSGEGVYHHTEGNLPVFQIPYIKNPLPKECISIWKRNINNDILEKNLDDIEIAMYYPNIFDFSNIISAGYTDIAIEYNECFDNAYEFDDLLGEYISVNPNYASLYINKQLPQPLLDYKPLEDINYLYSDYASSEFYGDFRAYKLSKLIELLGDSTPRYDMLYSDINNRIKRFFTSTFTYDKNPDIFNRSVFNSSIHDKNITPISFVNEMIYIEIFNVSHRYERCDLFIDGLKVPIEYTTIQNFKTVIYFRKSFITINSIITVDTFTFIDKEQHNTKIVFQGLASRKLKLPSCDNDISGADLIFYRKSDNQYVENGNFDFSVLVYQYTLNHENAFYKRALSMQNYQQLFNTDQQVFTVLNERLFVVQETLVEVENTGSSNFHKLLPINALKVHSNSYDYSYRDIMISNVNISFEYLLHDINNNSRIEITNYKGKPSESRLKVYIAGRKLMPSQYVITFSKKHNHELIIEFTDSAEAFINKDCIIEHTGFDEDYYVTHPIKFNANDQYYVIPNYNNKNYDLQLMRIFYNGLRLESWRIKKIKVDSMILLNLNGIYNAGASLEIYSQSTDSDVYKWKNALTVQKDTDTESILQNLYENNQAYRNYFL